MTGGASPAAVVFDLDGVLIDSESVWSAAREQVARAHGGHWPDDAPRAMIGMSSIEWSQYMHDRLGVQLEPAQISAEVVATLEREYRRRLPLMPGARQAVGALARNWPLGLASSANRPIIELVLERSGLRACFAATVSSEEVRAGKPAPDVYLEAARRLGVAAQQCVAVEDSGNGLRSAHAAAMTVLAIPNREFPPGPGELRLAADRLGSLRELTPARVRRVFADVHA